jgi:hypothetical protein
VDLNEEIATRVRGWIAAWPLRPDHPALYRVLRFLSLWRAIVLAQAYVAREGAVVYQGLFRGMSYLEQSSQGTLLPRLLGIYEAELHPHFEALVRDGLDVIVDVGCAEGYYAVGLARLAPEVVVHAHDIDPKARKACAELAQLNGVAERVVVGGEFKPADFQGFAGRRVLVLVDAEGAEVEILDPALAPALAEMSIVVETHDLFRPGAEALIVSRFSATHEITRVLQRPKAYDMPPWMEGYTDLDLLLASWECRDQPTPWLVMRPRRTG